MPKEKVSAGFLMYRYRNGELEFLLAHPGGPFWAKKDEWAIPKGESHPDEELLAAAEREFEEETSIKPELPYIELGTIVQKNGKTVYAWGFEKDVDPSTLKSNLCEVEWPPRSGKKIMVPEMDRFEFFTRKEAEGKARSAHLIFIDRLIEKLTPPAI